MAEEQSLQARIAALSKKLETAQRVQKNPLPQQQYQSPRWSPYRGRAAHHSSRQLILNNDGVQAHHPDSASRVPHNKPWQPNPMPQFVQRGGTAQHAQETERELIVGGIRFKVKPDGSKLVRAADPNDDRETPKMTTIAGVTFLRTKQGNLARVSNSNEASRYPNMRTGRQTANSLLPRVRTSKRTQCGHFTKHGKCPRGPNCKFAHDPNKIAICKDFLRSGSCRFGDKCDLSHEPTYHRAPACAHFLRGNCTNSACRYPHINVSLAAPVCRAYASLGYCSKGPACEKQHIHECPDYANHGHCANREKGLCKLPHTDHAATLRKAEQRRAKIAAGGFDSDLSSDDEQESDGDTNADGDPDAIEFLPGSDDEIHQLAQQQDFVAFS